jgi:hypothetical protein
MTDNPIDIRCLSAVSREITLDAFESRKAKPVYVLPVKDGVMTFWHMGDGMFDVNITLSRPKNYQKTTI